MAAKKTSTKPKKSPVKKKKAAAGGGIELSTVLFKDMVTRAKKAVSNSVMSPLSSMMAIELKDNKLTLITTDATNYLYVMQDNIEGDDFYVTVMADTFSQLVAKTTSEKIKLELEGTALKVTGNGEYLIELPEEEGEPIKFPSPRDDDGVELEPLDDIDLAVVQSIVDTAKASLAVTLEEPCYVNYYCGEQIIATDIEKICIMEAQLWEEPRLIPAEVFDLVCLMTEDTIHVSAKDDIIMFSTADCVVYARTADGIDDFATEEIGALRETEYPSSCKVKRSDVLQLLDRLSLFVTKNDKNVIYVTFTEDGLEITSKKSNGVEVVEYIENNDFTEFTCALDINMLESQVKAIADDTLTIEYGIPDGEDSANTLKFVDDDTDLFIALAEDDRE